MSCSGSHLGIPINIKNTKFVKEVFFFMPIRNPWWLPMQDIVLTQYHIGKYRKNLFLKNYSAEWTHSEFLGLFDKNKGWNSIINIKEKHSVLTSRKNINTPEARKSLYRSPGYIKNQLVLCKNHVIWNSTCNPCFSTFDQICFVFHGLKTFFFVTHWSLILFVS
jgi:hypothetical protein